jgi:hypothetical protein
MIKSTPLSPSHTEPSQVWEQLDADYQRRVLQLLARIALNFLTAHAVTPPMEDSQCLNNAVPQSYDPTTSRAPR